MYVQLTLILLSIYLDGRESFYRTKELSTYMYHPNSQGYGGSASCMCIISVGVPELSLEWFLLCLGLVVEDEPSKLS